MSIDKFRFVSPGVFVNEIDNSAIPRAPDEMGPVIIGRSQRGPMMRPVRVESFSDFSEVFGEPLPGGQGGDVWRDGNKTAPTYGAYAAQAYLRNSGAVTFVRLGGYQHENKAAGGEAGWKMNNAYGLFVVPVTESSTDVWDTEGTASATLAAVIYASGSNYQLYGKELSGGSNGNGLNKFLLSKGNNLEFEISVAGKRKLINFDKDSKKYIRSVLNTNPILTNNNLVSSPEDYFLGETFKTFVQQYHNITDSTKKFAGVLVRLATADFSFSNHKYGARNAETGWVISQHKGLPSEFTVEPSSGEYPVQKLFKLVGLSEGEWNSQNLKISIEDIKAPPNEYVKFGTFTVSVRKMSDNDLTPTYLERFTGLTLDPSSENYIAKKIGDKYSKWEYEKNSYVEYGMYNNRSKFIRVEMDPDVDNGFTDKDLIPFGFYGPSTLVEEGQEGDELTASFIDGTVTSSNAIAVKFTLPELPMLKVDSQSAASSLNSVYFGFKTNVDNTKKYNEDMVDVVRSNPNGFPVIPSFIFSLDEIKATVTSEKLDKTEDITWTVGSRASSDSLTADGYTTLLLSNLNRFTMPLVGGSDGVDITEKDPFNARKLNETGADQYTNYAFNSIKVAIESVADPEVVECNLMAIPGVENESLTSLLMDKCETRGDALAIIDLKGDYIPEEGKASASTAVSARKPVVDNVIANLKARGINSSYGCAFFPCVIV